MDARRAAATRLKWPGVFLISLAACGATFGQTDPSNSNVEILKLHWQKQVRLPRNYDPSVIPTNGSFVDPASRSSGAPVTSGATEMARTNNARSAASPNSPSAFPAGPARLPIFYIYSLKLRNSGPKAIAGVAWDYLFIDAANNAELGAHQFLSYEKISPEQSATLKAQLRSPPTRVVRPADPAANKQPKLIERSVIQCILYADDTVWKNPQGRADVCALLKHDKALIKRKAG